MAEVAGGLDNEITNIWVETEELEKNVLSEAKANKRTLERDLERYTSISNLLYILGWGLALVGKLFGVEGLAGSAI